jgi:hypothetical protein
MSDTLRKSPEVENVEKYQFIKKKADIWRIGEADPPYIQYLLSGKVLCKHPKRWVP